MTRKGTDLDTYHQTIIPILFLSTWLYKAYPSNHMQNHHTSVEILQIFPNISITVSDVCYIVQKNSCVNSKCLQLV